MLTHTIGCCWLGMGSYYGLGATDWLPGEEFKEISGVASYARAFFWAFTAMTSNGLSPKQPLEVLFSLAIVFVGLTFYATIIGSVGSIMINNGYSSS